MSSNKRNNIIFYLSVIFLGLLLGGCNVVKTENYQHKQPTLTMEDYFSGHVKGYGMVQDRSGEVRRRFVVDMYGKWQGDKGLLDEYFVFDDGEKQHRQWHLLHTSPHQFSAKAGDVTGQASGEQYGNTIHMKYVLQIPTNGRVYDITMDDWLYRIDEKIVLNRAAMKKFGFNVGSVTTSFYKYN